MWSIGELKAKGKEAFKSNYWSSVIVALILSLLTGGAGASARSQTSQTGGQEGLDMSALTPEGMAVIVGALSVVFIVALLLRIFLFNPLEVGGFRFFKKNVEGEHPTVGMIKEGFGEYGRTFITMFLRDLFLSLWTCLFIIPGIVKGYSYRMVPYIIKDNPELSATEVITKSREMMNGHKWRAFLLDLSFIGWILLTLCTCGLLGIFWTNPYIQNTNAALYLELSKNQ